MFRRILLLIAAINCFSIQLIGQSDDKLGLSFFPSDKEFPINKIPQLEFSEIDAAVPSFMGGEQIYVHLKISAEESQKPNNIFLSYSLLDSISLYFQTEEGFALQQKTGQAFPFKTRLNPLTDFNFKVVEGVQDYYFKISSHKPVVLPFELISDDQLMQKVTNFDFFMGMYIGIVVIMLLYNLVIYFLTRDKSYLFYVLYLLFLWSL